MNSRQQAYVRAQIRGILFELARGVTNMATAERMIFDSIQEAQDIDEMVDRRLNERKKGD